MEKDTRRRVGAQIQSARRARHWGQPELAEKAGVSVGTISNTELGKSWPQPNHLRAILDALEIRLDGLVGSDVVDPGEDEGGPTALAWFLDLHADVRTALYMVGLYLERFDDEERDARIREVVSAIVDRRL